MKKLFFWNFLCSKMFKKKSYVKVKNATFKNIILTVIQIKNHENFSSRFLAIFLTVWKTWFLAKRVKRFHVKETIFFLNYVS